MAMMRLCSLLVVVMLMSLTMCEVRGLPRRSVLDDAEASLEQIREGIARLITMTVAIEQEMANESSSEGCRGYPCMYTHLGSKAAKAALLKAQLALLSQCAHDPECAPGKRRRRSATAQAVLPLLTRDEKTTS